MKKYSIAVLIFITAIIAGYIGYLRWHTPQVSVVMLTYKRANIVPQAIESILNQTYKDFELIILNDGSPDNTDEVIAKYMKKDARIRYYKNDQNRGIPYSRNRVASLARGKYIAIMDDDDICLPKRLEKQVEFLEKNPNIDVVIGQIKNLPKVPLLHNDIAAGLIQYNNVGNANIMYHRNFTEKNNIKYPEISYGEDWYFWLNVLFKGGRFASINDIVLIRKDDSKKHYKSDASEAYPAIHNFIGSFFSSENPHKFYEAEACEKLKMIKNAPVQIFTNDYLQILIRSNCFSD